MKSVQQEIRINARKLSTPGPRLMAENAIRDQQPALLRIIVSSDEAARDVAAYLQTQGADVRTDILGEDIHVIARFGSGKAAGKKEPGH
jgi:TusA-related sulfurtransferase